MQMPDSGRKYIQKLTERVIESGLKGTASTARNTQNNAELTESWKFLAITAQIEN